MTGETMTEIYTIERTRLVTEVYRIEADSEDEAVDALAVKA